MGEWELHSQGEKDPTVTAFARKRVASRKEGN